MHYQQGKNRNQIFLTTLDEMVPLDSWARIVDLFVDSMPILELGFKHARLNKEGNLPYSPSDMFKLLLYGYRKGIRSSYKLSDACLINVEVKWLLKDLHPSPRTINYFRANNTKAIENAHRHFVKMLKNWKLVEGKVMALDGTKVRGVNSKKNNFNQKKVNRHLKYIEDSITPYLMALEELEHKKKLKAKDKKLKKR